jgi:hypothetical protein
MIAACGPYYLGGSVIGGGARVGTGDGSGASPNFGSPPGSKFAAEEL